MLYKTGKEKSADFIINKKYLKLAEKIRKTNKS
jgi:hypothetical protein